MNQVDTWYSRNKARSSLTSRTWYLKNKARKLELNRQWRARNVARTGLTLTPSQRATQRAHVYKKTYGITVRQYDEMFALQGGVCSLCGYPSNKRLHIDHDAATRRVRGLLCSNCNTGIGLLGHDADRLARAIEYLMPPLVALKESA